MSYSGLGESATICSNTVNPKNLINEVLQSGLPQPCMAAFLGNARISASLGYVQVLIQNVAPNSATSALLGDLSQLSQNSRRPMYSAIASVVNKWATATKLPMKNFPDLGLILIMELAPDINWADLGFAGHIDSVNHWVNLGEPPFPALLSDHLLSSPRVQRSLNASMERVIVASRPRL